MVSVNVNSFYKYWSTFPKSNNGLYPCLSLLSANCLPVKSLILICFSSYLRREIRQKIDFITCGVSLFIQDVIWSFCPWLIILFIIGLNLASCSLVVIFNFGIYNVTRFHLVIINFLASLSFTKLHCDGRIVYLRGVGDT